MVTTSRSLKRFLLVPMVLVACSSEPDSIVPNQDAKFLDHAEEQDGALVNSTDAEIAITDTPAMIGSFGHTCLSNADCDSGYCTETPNGNVCTKSCVSDCPKGFYCATVASGSTDVVSVCLSSFVRLCDPCHEHKDCNTNSKAGNICVTSGNGGGFCGVQCNPLSESSDCPANFVCQFVTDAKTGTSAHQCIPSGNAVCTCSVRATQLALSTTCTNKNTFGSCTGTRVCKPAGLTNCIGQIPEIESCNKLDDNCDDVTDNISPETIGESCKQTNEFGTCHGNVIGCKNGEPLCGAIKPEPEMCNGKDDNCNGKTDEGLCDDGNVCTIDQCNTDGSCKLTKVSGTACDDGNVCTTFEQCSSGVCVGGTILNCDDGDSCSTDWCDPFTGCNHKPASDGNCLDDGNACTQDVCANGKCTHPKAKDGNACLDEGNVCTKDVCDAGECSHIANQSPCNDDNQCTLNDTCKDKTCSVSLPKVCNDGNACTTDACDVKKGCVFKPNPFSDDGTGVPCPEDGNVCTNDICKGSICAHVPIPGCN